RTTAIGRSSVASSASPVTQGSFPNPGASGPLRPHPAVGIDGRLVYSNSSRIRLQGTCTISSDGMNPPPSIEPASSSSADLYTLANRLLENVGQVVLGKSEQIKLAVVALLAEGHVLIEDVPGVGKTLLAKALAASIDCSFRRIQFTPDLLPSDVLGSS